MKRKELSLLYNYIYNNRYNLEDELKQLQTNLRYRSIDVVDCSELICAMERYNTFMQVSKDIMSLLNMKEIELEDE